MWLYVWSGKFVKKSLVAFVCSMPDNTDHSRYGVLLIHYSSAVHTHSSFPFIFVVWFFTDTSFPVRHCIAVSVSLAITTMLIYTHRPCRSFVKFHWGFRSAHAPCFRLSSLSTALSFAIQYAPLCFKEVLLLTLLRIVLSFSFIVAMLSTAPFS